MPTITHEHELHLEAAASPSTHTVAPEPAVSIAIEPAIHSAIWARFTQPFISGQTPCCRTADLAVGLKMEDAVACIPAALVSRQMRANGNSTVLIETDSYAAVVQYSERRSGSVTVRSETIEQADAAVVQIAGWFPTAESEPTSVSVDFWQSGQHMFTTSRSIEASSWDDVSHHYPAEVRSGLDDLMTLELNEPAGRVILWHGPPGTGKTSAIRTLARAWQSHATFQVVLDPEPVFAHSAKLMQVILNHRDQQASRWRVLVIEDADEIVRADNATTSQSLSRLLNVGDGIVGQGLKVLVLLTTNEPPSRLHPALTRPGRCLTNIAFRKFSRPETIHAFPDAARVGSGDMSLAEILTGRLEEGSTSASYGQYL